jgi:sec-independent protein translocase protein TatA
MPNVGPLELAIVLIIALVIFGPKRLPELGKSLGKGMREFKDSISGDNADEDDDDELPPQIENGVEEDADAASAENRTRDGEPAGRGSA